MSNIIYFDNSKQFQEYLREKAIYSNFLGKGAEGACYQSPIDSYAYKIFHGANTNIWEEESEYQEFCREIGYSTDTIITSKDIETQSFLFPITLFVHRDLLLGYTTKYIPKNLFDCKYIGKQSNLPTIDFDKLLEAYEIMIKDIEKLSQEQIRIFDLPPNLIFNGERLYGIDTCGYKRVDYDVLKENLDSLKHSIIYIFETWTRHFRYSPQFNNIKTEEYIKEIKEKHADKVKSLIY